MMSKDQLEELKFKQATAPEEIECICGNVDDTYEFPEHELNYVHCVVRENMGFDPNTGERLGQDVIQKFTPAEYHRMVSNATLIGYDITVLHRPAELELMEAAAAKKKVSQN